MSIDNREELIFMSTIIPNIDLQLTDNRSSLTFSASEIRCPFDIRSVNFTEYAYHYRTTTWKEITVEEDFKILLYIVAFLFSVFGNVLVILVVYNNVHMRSPTNQYLVNLAVADLLVTLFCMWVHLVRHLSHPNYVLPALFCKLDSFVQVTALMASVLTLTIISIGRLVAVMFPLHVRTTSHKTHRVIFIIWLASAILASPTILYRELYSVQWQNFKSWHCEEFWPTNAYLDNKTNSCVVTYDSKKLFYTILTVALYFIPICVMLVNYSLVVWRLWMTQIPGEQCQPARNTATKSKRKVVKMVLIVLLTFILCWTPLQSLVFYSNFVHAQDSDGDLPGWFSTVEFAAYFIAYSNSAVNPFIYCGFNGNFRKGILAILKCRNAGRGRFHYKKTWKAATAGTRETVFGQPSGPEPDINADSKKGNRRLVDNVCLKEILQENRLDMPASPPSCKPKRVMVKSVNENVPDRLRDVSRETTHNRRCMQHDDDCVVCEASQLLNDQGSLTELFTPEQML